MATKAPKHKNGFAVQYSKGAQALQFDPNEVEISEAMRMRHFPPSDAQVAKIAYSMLQEGQIEPIEVRQTEDRKPIATVGVTRVLAGRKIRAGFAFGGQTYLPLPEWTVAAIVNDVDEATARRRAVRENNDRHSTSPVDDAFNQQKFRDIDGMNDTQIAELYGCHRSLPGQYKKLLKLDEGTLRLVHDGDLAFNAAIELIDIPEDQRARLLAQAGHTITGIREAKPQFLLMLESDKRREEEWKRNPTPEPTAAGDSTVVDLAAPDVGPTVESGPASAVTPAPALASVDNIADAPAAPKGHQRTIKQVKMLIGKYTGEQTIELYRVVFAGLLAFIDNTNGMDGEKFGEMMQKLSPHPEDTPAAIKLDSAMIEAAGK